MNKKDLAVVIPLVVLALAWGPIYSRFFAKPQPVVESSAPSTISGTTEISAPSNEVVAPIKEILSIPKNAEELVLSNDKLSLDMARLLKRFLKIM